MPIGTCALLLLALDRPNDNESLDSVRTAPVWVQVQVLTAFSELPDANETAVLLARDIVLVTAAAVVVSRNA